MNKITVKKVKLTPPICHALVHSLFEIVFFYLSHNTCNALVASKALMLTNGSGLYKVFSTESVLNLLHCLFCRKPYKDPRLLHCGHTYCLPCLVQMNRYSTIRCIKCNSLHTVTSHAVDTLPKNLFVADIQCIPTVEIDRGAAYKETLKSLEDLKIKLLDFSDKLDQSEEKLLHVSEIKKNEVTEQINKMMEYIRQLEEEFHNEIEEFKNNRLSWVDGFYFLFWILTTCQNRLLTWHITMSFISLF